MSLAEALLSVTTDRSEKSGGVINYESFAEVRHRLSERPNLAKFLTPVLFMKMPKDAHGCIHTDVFMRFLDTKIEYERMYIQLQKYDSESTGYLRESDLRTFISDLVPNLRGLRELDEDCVPFYAFGATKKFMFHLDPRKSGKVAIEDLVVTPLMRDFMELRHGPLNKSNWFGAVAAMQVYSQYLELDIENDGMLSKKELSLGSPRWNLTPAAIQRLFEEHLSFGDKLDYRGYLDLVLALENPDTVSAKRYLWKLLNGNNPLGLKELRFFLSSQIEALSSKMSVSYKLSDLCVEFLDILQVKENARVEFRDVLSHQNGGIFLKMLVDTNAFLNYDNRESLILVSLQTDS